MNSLFHYHHHGKRRLFLKYTKDTDSNKKQNSLGYNRNPGIVLGRPCEIPSRVKHSLASVVLKIHPQTKPRPPIVYGETKCNVAGHVETVGVLDQVAELKKDLDSAVFYLNGCPLFCKNFHIRSSNDTNYVSYEVKQTVDSCSMSVYEFDTAYDKQPFDCSQFLPQNIEGASVYRESSIRNELAIKDYAQQIQVLDFLGRVGNTKNATKLIQELEEDLEVALQSIGSLMDGIDGHCHANGPDYNVQTFAQNLWPIVSLYYISIFALLKRCTVKDLDKLGNFISHGAVRTLTNLGLLNSIKGLELRVIRLGISLLNEKNQKKRAMAVEEILRTSYTTVLATQKYMMQTLCAKSRKIDASKDESDKETSFTNLIQCWYNLERMQGLTIHMYPERTKEINDSYLEAMLDAVRCSASILQNPETIELVKNQENITKIRATVVAEDHIFLVHEIIPFIFHIHTTGERLVKRVMKQSLLSFRDFPGLKVLGSSWSDLLLALLTRTIQSTQCKETLSRRQIKRTAEMGRQVCDFIIKYQSGLLFEAVKNKKGVGLIRKLKTRLENNIAALYTKFLNYPEETHKGGEFEANCSLSSHLVPLKKAQAPVPTVIPSMSADDKVLSGFNSLDLGTPFANPEIVDSTIQEAINVEGMENPMFSLVESIGALLKEESSGLVQLDSPDWPLMPDPNADNAEQYVFSEMEIVDILGEGSTGEVKLVKIGHQDFAVKFLHNQETKRCRERLRKEVKIHKAINNHANILRYYGVCVDRSESGNKEIGIVTEFCELGSLMKVIEHSRNIKETGSKPQHDWSSERHTGYRLLMHWKKRLEVASEIALAISYLHSRYVVHRDITSYNILLHFKGGVGDFGVKLCDFERANFVAEGEKLKRSEGFPNSPPWASPEVLNGQDYDLSTDVFSMGTVLWELIYLEDPWCRLKSRFSPCNKATITARLANGSRLPFLDHHVYPNLPEYFSLCNLIQRAWNTDPTARPSMKEIYNELTSIRDQLN